MSIKVGTVKSVNAEKCTARVKFEDTGMISAELQVTSRGSLKNQEYWIPKIEEQVLCMFTDQKVGYIISSIYSESVPPPVKSEFKRHMAFEDGTFLEYDSKTHTLTIDCKGPIHLKSKGNILVTGDVIADGISLKNHTHSSNGSKPGE